MSHPHVGLADLAACPELFADSVHDVRNFREYLGRVRRDADRDGGAWGDHLTLAALAHLLLRPIVCITDDPNHATMPPVNPPEFVSTAVWGDTLYLVHYGENHYEATAPL